MTAVIEPTVPSPPTDPPIAVAPPARRAEKVVRPIAAGAIEEKMAIASSALTMICILCAWMLLQVLVLGGFSEQRSQHLLYTEFRSQLAQAIAPTGELDYDGNPLKAGSPVALLNIPRLGLNQVVVDGTAPGDLMNGPGHERDTPMPGQVGVSVVDGRSTTYGAPFANIDQLVAGDRITVTNASGVVTYTVEDVRRANDKIPALPTGGAVGRLTLVTAAGNGFLSALRPSDAIYVDAITTKATAAGAVGGILPDSEKVMARDTSQLPILVLLLLGLAALVLAVSVARRHVRAILVWTCAVPVAIALSWGITDQVMRLLPNLM